MITRAPRLDRFIDAFLKAAGDMAETESVRPYTAGDTARRLPGLRTGLSSRTQTYTAPSPPTASTSDTAAGARSLSPPSVR